MPIEYRIVHEGRIVLGKAHGTLTDEELFSYQREVWSRSDVAGYDELLDMTAVKKVALDSVDRLRELARLSALLDSRSLTSRVAIAAPSEAAFGLGRLYEAYRRSEVRSTKRVAVFRSLAEALAFLRTGADPLTNEEF
jgi:hypothetical protein